MPPPQATEALYTTLQRYQLLLVFGARRLWQSMTPDFDRSWSGIAPSMEALTSGAQLAAATAATAYVPQVLAETGQPDEPEARVRPRAFAGVASDGRSLAGLLEGSVVAAKQAVRAGAAPNVALVGGQKWLEMALQTAVSDAARDATAAEIAVRQDLGWVRQVNPPCCRDCAVLAGKWFRWNDGFDRHPNCDCVHIPSRENVADDFVTDPQLLLERGLVKGITRDQQARLDAGADPVKVLNEQRDRTRVRQAADRNAAKDTWGGTPTSMPPGGVQDFLSHLTNRVDALKGLRAAGIAD